MGINRTKCVITKVTEDEFSLFSFEPALKWKLDARGAWVWFLLDGAITPDQIAEKITQRYPEVSTRECYGIIENLIDQGLASDSNAAAISMATQKKLLRNFRDPVRPLKNLNVHLVDFPQTLDLIESYLIWLLWHLAETLTITASIEEAEIAFYFQPENNTDSHIENVEHGALKVLVSESPLDNLPHLYDYIISTAAAPSQTSHHLTWLRLPGFDLKLGTLPDEKTTARIGKGYAIERLKEKLAIFLLGPKQQQGADGSNLSGTLTIGMATYDDYDGVYFSITALSLYHREVFKRSEIIILDNNPEGPAAAHLQALANQFENVRYEIFSERSGTAVRDRLFYHATSKWVLCMDSHVMFESGSLDRLVKYIMENPDSKDMLQGPVLDDTGAIRGTHFVAQWVMGMYGTWGIDERGCDPVGEPFEIEMQGLGVFACRKDAWPGFNNAFHGFGGEEGYIHQKIRNSGGHCLCLPFLRWTHRFARPHGPRYEVNWRHRIRNYMIGFEEAGLDTKQITEYFSAFLSTKVTRKAQLSLEREKQSPFSYFDHIVCINLDHNKARWKKMCKRFDRMGIKNRVHQLSAIHTPELYHIGCALSHRKAIEQARDYGHKNILVFEDDAMLLSGAEIFLARALKELEGKKWKVLYLGGTCVQETLELDESCKHLMKVPRDNLTSSHALVYNKSVYAEILQALPDNELEMSEWLVDNYAIARYLRTIDSRFLVYPKPFSQRELLAGEDPEYRYSYN